MKIAGLLAAALLAGAGCGYHVAGQADLVPKDIRTIAIPAFENVTTRYRLTQHLAKAVAREFLTRTRYRVVADPDQGDAILFGAVVNYIAYPTVFDPRTGRASGMQSVVVLDIRLVRRGTGEVLYENRTLRVDNRYEISADQEAYFEESDAALARVSQAAARKVVSAILENF